MKTSLIVIVLLYCSQLYSQHSAADFIKNQCEYIIDGKEQTYGIKMKYNAPCDWDTANETRVYFTKSHTYEIKDSGLLVCTVLINKIKGKYDKTEEQNIFKKEWAKDAFKNVGDLITVKKVDIDAHKWAEYVLQKTINAPQGEIHQYLVCYYILYKGIGIMVSYKVVSSDPLISAFLYIDYLETFRVLASSISVFNFWPN